MRFLRSMLIVNESKENARRVPITDADFVASNLTLPTISDDMIETADIFEDGHIRFYFSDVPDNIKKALIKQVKSSDNYNLEGYKVERYVFDMEVATDGESITYATMGVSVILKPEGGNSNAYGGEYDTLPVVFDSAEEHESVMRALRKVKNINN